MILKINQQEIRELIKEKIADKFSVTLAEEQISLIFDIKADADKMFSVEIEL